MLVNTKLHYLIGREPLKNQNGILENLNIVTVALFCHMGKLLSEKLVRLRHDHTIPQHS